MHIWIKSLNEFYKKKIEGSNKIITIIQNAYSDEKKIERMLSLLDVCRENDLQMCFGKKLLGVNQELVVQIKDIVSKYSLTIEIENKTLGDILDEMQRLKREYKSKICAEKQVEINPYNTLKTKNNVVCQIMN